jgi:hypothetical protein
LAFGTSKKRKKEHRNKKATKAKHLGVEHYVNAGKGFNRVTNFFIGSLITLAPHGTSIDIFIHNHVSIDD